MWTCLPVCAAKKKKKEIGQAGQEGNMNHGKTSPENAIERHTFTAC